MLQPHWSYGYISLLHPRPLVWSGTALRSEACRHGGKEDNTLMARCGASGGLSIISRHQRGVEGALKEQGLSLFQGKGKSVGNMNFSPGSEDYDGRVCLLSHSFQSFGDVSRATAGNSAPFRARTTRPLTIIFQITENYVFFL